MIVAELDRLDCARAKNLQPADTVWLHADKLERSLCQAGRSDGALKWYVLIVPIQGDERRIFVNPLWGHPSRARATSKCYVARNCLAQRQADTFGAWTFVIAPDIRAIVDLHLRQIDVGEEILGEMRT